MLTASDVLGTGWFAADAAGVKPGMTVAVGGGGAVGLLGVLAAKLRGAERILAMSRHAARQQLARAFGATDIVIERGDEGIARIKELTGGVGADAVLACVGAQQSMRVAPAPLATARIIALAAARPPADGYAISLVISAPSAPSAPSEKRSDIVMTAYEDRICREGISK